LETGNEGRPAAVTAIRPSPMLTEMKLFSVLGKQIGLILVDLVCASVQFATFG
jgi:hypothetical protein